MTHWVRRCTWAALTLGLLLATADSKEPEAGKSDQELIQGRWQMVAAKANGRPLPPEYVKAIRRVRVDGDKWIQTIGEDDPEPGRHSFKLNSSKDPKTIDRTDLDPAEAGKVCLGIYRLEGDTLMVVERRPGLKDRPTKFESDDRDTLLQIYKRMKLEK